MRDLHAMGARRWVGRHAVALMLAATWTGLAGLLTVNLARADRDARFLYLVETQVCHVPAVAAVADPRKAPR